MNYVEIGQVARREIAKWRTYAVGTKSANICNAQSYHFAFDLFSHFKYEDKMSDDRLGRFVKTCTAEFLRSHGYNGARSNRGISIGPFFTAVEWRLEQRFGKSATFNPDKAQVKSEMGRDVDTSWWFRGVLDDPAIVQIFFIECQILFHLVNANLVDNTIEA